jgi:hypothetical protein
MQTFHRASNTSEISGMTMSALHSQALRHGTSTMASCTYGTFHREKQQ